MKTTKKMLCWPIAFVLGKSKKVARLPFLLEKIQLAARNGQLAVCRVWGKCSCLMLHPQIVLHMRTWFLNHWFPHYATVIVIHVSFVSHSKLSPKASSNSRWIKKSTFKSAMRAAAPSGISKNSSWPIWAFQWNDGRMDGHCNIYIYIYISTYNIHIYMHTHLGLSFTVNLWWNYSLGAAQTNVAVDIVNVNIFIKVPSWNSDFQWFSLCHRVGAGPNCSKPIFPTPWKTWLVKAHF